MKFLYWAAVILAVLVLIQINQARTRNRWTWSHAFADWWQSLTGGNATVPISGAYNGPDVNPTTGERA